IVSEDFCLFLYPTYNFVPHLLGETAAQVLTPRPFKLESKGGERSRRQRV
ncbi:hypothetical protein ACO22_08033, partial [Paracoccidioides brasiliensis]